MDNTDKHDIQHIQSHKHTYIQLPEEQNSIHQIQSTHNTTTLTEIFNIVQRLQY